MTIVYPDGHRQITVGATGRSPATLFPNLQQTMSAEVPEGHAQDVWDQNPVEVEIEVRYKGVLEAEYTTTGTFNLSESRTGMISVSRWFPANLAEEGEPPGVEVDGQSLHAMTVAVRELTAISTDHHLPDPADVAELRRLVPLQRDAPLDELACEVIQQAMTRREDIKQGR